MRDVDCEPTLPDGGQMIVTLYSTKGGCGKTTLALCLAAYWSKNRSTVLVDADPQASLELCDKHVLPVPIIRDTSEDIGKTVTKLAKDYERVVVDTAGFKRKKNLDALTQADFVLIPCKPSPFDVREAIAAVELVREIAESKDRKRHPLYYGMVLTMAQRTAISAQIRQDLIAAKMPIMGAQIGQRVAFVETPIAGLPDEGSVAFLEIRLLAKEIRRKAKD